MNREKKEPHKTIDHATEKRLPYYDKEGKEDEMGGKIASILQNMLTEEAATKYAKAYRKNEQNKSIIMNGNVKRCA